MTVYDSTYADDIGSEAYQVDFGNDTELYPNLVWRTIVKDMIVRWQHYNFEALDYEHGSFYTRMIYDFELYHKEHFEWCNQNCEETWGYGINNVFYFKSESDMIQFKIRWFDV